MPLTQANSPANRPAGDTAETLPPALPPAANLARLALLHDEAHETALLANLLGRAPAVATALVALALVAAGFCFAQSSVAALVVWLVLVAASAGAILRGYVQAIRVPFERTPLRAFSEDLSAIMLYAGFAWGAGAFLVLPSALPLPGLVLFSAGTCMAVAALLRAREHALLFLAPVAGLCTMAPVIRGDVRGLYVLAACGLAAGLIQAADRLFASAPPQPMAGISAH
jgi:hypothetical protein